MRSNQCKEIIREIYPYLVGKQHEARLLLGCPSSGELAEATHAGLINLHNGRNTDIDFSPPESMFQPGFYLRQDIIWKKPNPMPESVTDRCTKAHEYIFLLSKNARYYYDQEAVKVEGAQNKWGKYHNPKYGDEDNLSGKMQSAKELSKEEYIEKYETINLRSVWTVTTKPYPESHFATFPPDLIIPCIKAGSKEGDIVLDPFFGSGTTREVCIKLGRQYIGCELQENYAPLIEKRTRQQGLNL
jgi:DNA modification methylase